MSQEPVVQPSALLIVTVVPVSTNTPRCPKYLVQQYLATPPRDDPYIPGAGPRNRLTGLIASLDVHLATLSGDSPGGAR